MELQYGSTYYVRGVATLDNLLFVVCIGSPAVSVFDLTSFHQLEDIGLRGLLEDAQDIATCEVTRRIYVADRGNGSVWCIDWSSPSTRSTAADNHPSSFTDKFVSCEVYCPWRLSTSKRSQQLLVTGFDESLYVYDVDGKLLRRVELSTEVDDDGVKWFDTRHAVHATTGENFYVCRVGTRQQSGYTHAEVAEYNSTGQRSRSYYSAQRGDGPQQVKWPEHMSMIGDGRFLVADRDNHRVIVLNSELRLERVLFTEQQLKVDDDANSSGGPVGICYNPRSGHLCVLLNHRYVYVYETC